ncbi:MAG TPA: hypothetical protein VK013_11415 [Myxococcaceae bacterium]|nr:hypothetical protein [Myxococcaceae bacterium]
MRHLRLLFPTLVLVSLTACEVRQPTEDVYHRVGSFVVTLEELSHEGGDGEAVPLTLTADCLDAHGGSADAVPEEIRGTEACRYAVPKSPVDLTFSVRTLDRQNQPLTDFNRRVAIRVVPGTLPSEIEARSMELVNGEGRTTVRATHLFDTVHIWVEDAEPKPTPGMQGGQPVGGVEDDPTRSYATGVSAPIVFQEPTLQILQEPEGADNRGSPFTGRFVTIGRAPEGGAIVRQNCEDPTDPAHGLPMMLVVTGADNAGFYVTDLTACRANEHVRFNAVTGSELFDPSTNQSVYGITPEPARTETVPAACTARTGMPSTLELPAGVNPGRFGSVYVYNYNYPEGLFPGDLLWTIAGSVQEFTSTTQLTFPSWTIRDSVSRRAPEAWDDFLSCLPIADVNLRTCGVEDTDGTWITDVICGQNTRNLKLESLESGLVRIQGVRFPTHFENCDLNGDGQVSFFCDASMGSGRAWHHCDFDNSTLKPDFETACNIACTTMQPTVGEEPFLPNVPKTSRTYDFEGAICAERSTYVGFGQYVVELPGPGDAEGGLDPSLTQRYETLELTGTAAIASRNLSTGLEAVVWCNRDVHYRFGNGSLATVDDPVLPAGQRLDHKVVSGNGTLSVLGTGDEVENARCTVGQNPRTRINVITRDSVPDLEPDCNPDDPDADRATQCRAIRGATFDIVGHLKHIQPARPRWGVIPRDANDICCHPGPGLECPRPIKTCQ